MGGGNSASSLAAHFARENQKVKDFMSGGVGSRGKSVTMDNGQILERYSMKEMKNYVLKEFKGDGGMSDDYAIFILYDNGDIAAYTGGDDTSKMRLSNIKGVIYENPNTSAYSGSGVVIENWNEKYAGSKGTRYGTDKDEDDWRLDFE